MCSSDLAAKRAVAAGLQRPVRRRGDDVELKRTHGLRRLRVRRLPRVRFAVATKIIACNVKRMVVAKR